MNATQHNDNKISRNEPNKPEKKKKKPLRNTLLQINILCTYL